MKKYDLSKIMKDAWRNFRNRVASFSACLKDAWKNAKEAITMTKEEKIERFIEAGAKRWEKNGMDRLYINPRALGFSWECYKSGNIRYASDPNGDKISNSQMYRILDGKIWLDVNNEFTVHNNSCCEDEFVKMFVTGALEG